MGSMNKVILMGRLGQDPEANTTGTGKSVCNFSVATDGFTGGEKTTEWHRVVAWERVADVATQYLRKGSQVLIEGRLQTRKWEDRDGNTRYTTEIIAYSLQLTGTRNDAGQGQPASSQPYAGGQPPAAADAVPPPGPGVEDDELPF